MTSAVDEFELGARVGPPAPAPARRRRRGASPGLWVGLALAAVAVGVLAAPVAMPRASAEIPGWGGLGGVDWVMAEDDEADALSIARLAVESSTNYDSEGNIMGIVVVVAREVPEAPDDLVSSATAALSQMGFEQRLFTVLEDAAPHSHWVCEPMSEAAMCTALADPEITVHIDWPAS